MVADALSRRADLAALTVLGLAPGILEGVREGTSKDLAASRLLAQGTLVDRGGLYYTHDNDKLYVPEVCREGVLSECHTTPFSGHLGFKKTYELVCRNFWWENISSTVKYYCRACGTCQRVKGGSSLPYGLLQPIPIPELRR